MTFVPKLWRNAARLHALSCYTAAARAHVHPRSELVKLQQSETIREFISARWCPALGISSSFVLYIQDVTEHVWPTSRVDRASKNNEKSSCKRMFHLSSFMKCNESAVYVASTATGWSVKIQNRRSFLTKSAKTNIYSECNRIHDKTSTGLPWNARWSKLRTKQRHSTFLRISLYKIEPYRILLRRKWQ